MKNLLVCSKPVVGEIIEFMGHSYMTESATDECSGCDLFGYCLHGVDVMVDCVGSGNGEDANIIFKAK